MPVSLEIFESLIFFFLMYSPIFLVVDSFFLVYTTSSFNCLFSLCFNILEFFHTVFSFWCFPRNHAVANLASRKPDMYALVSRFSSGSNCFNSSRNSRTSSVIVPLNSVFLFFSSFIVIAPFFPFYGHYIPFNVICQTSFFHSMYFFVDL